MKTILLLLIISTIAVIADIAGRSHASGKAGNSTT
jgi:hypothetical protein